MTPRPGRDPAAHLLFVFGAGLLLLYALASRDSTNWTWGVNLGRYFPPAATWLALAAGLGALGLGWARAGSPAGGAEPAPAGRAPGGMAWLTAGILSLPVFWFLRERIHFLGDTFVRMESLHYIAAGYALPRDYSIIHAAPLDKLATVLAPAALSRWFHLPPEVGGALLPCLMGGMFVALAGWVASLMASSSAGRWAAWGLLVAAGYMQLFAGYLEAYGVQILSLLLWYGAVLRERRGESAPLVSTALAGLVLMAHRVDLLILPAQGWLWWEFLRSRRQGRGGEVRGLGLALSGFALALSVGMTLRTWLPSFGEDVGFLLSHSASGGGPDEYSHFSRVHLANVFNDFFLLLPLWLLGPLLALRRPAPLRECLVALLAGAPFWLLALYIRSIYRGLGAIRDWDALAPAGFFLALFAAHLLARLVDERPRLRLLAFAVVFAGMLPAAAWILLNADPARARARAELVLGALPRIPSFPRALGYEALALIDTNAGEPHRAALAFLSAAEAAPNPRYFWMAGVNEWNAGRAAPAESLWARAVSRPSPFRDQVTRLVAGDARQDSSDAMTRAMQKAIVSGARP